MKNIEDHYAKEISEGGCVLHNKVLQQLQKTGKH